LGLVVTSIDGSDASKLATLRATTTLKMPDACVLHHAMKVSGSIATTDNELAQAAKSKGVGVFSPQ
jgi:rRNA-processing protein FCF1